jgi:hypothetical protein
MKANVKNYLAALVFIASGMFFSTSISAFNEFNGNWSEKYNLGNGHYVYHTPKNVSLDGMFTATRSLHMDGVIINGTRFDYVYLYTDSTREEFTQAVKRIKMTKVY